MFELKLYQLDLEQEIIDKVNLKHEQSGGSSGYYISNLIFDLNSNYQVVKPILLKIYNDKKTTIRNGINGKMIFKK